VGINTAIIQGGQGIGFATPIQLAKSVLDQLKDKGKVTRGWLGVYIQPLSADVAEKLGVKDRRGALVSDVTKDGPAEQAGIRSGDVILAFNGKEIRDEHELPAAVAATKPGKKVDIRIVRDGKELTVPVTIAEMEGEPGKRGKPADLSKGLGLTVQDITPELANRLETENSKGVVVTSVEGGSPAEEAGFQEGDVIRQVERQPVPNVAEFGKLMTKYKGEKTVLFLVERGGARLFVTVKNK